LGFRREFLKCHAAIGGDCLPFGQPKVAVRLDSAGTRC
jgi:hypothetical protein